MKKILASLLIGVSLFTTSVQAQSWTYLTTNMTSAMSALGTNTFLLITGRYYVGNIQLIGNGVDNASVQFYDNNINAVTNVQPAYTSVVAYASNTMTYYTGYSGVIVTNTNSYYYYIPKPNAAAMITKPIVANMFTIGAGQVSTPYNLLFQNGIVVKLSTNATLSIQLRPWQ